MLLGCLSDLRLLVLNTSVLNDVSKHMFEL